MTDQTHIAPMETGLPDLDVTREKLSLLARTWRAITAPLPRSERMRRDIGLESRVEDYSPRDHIAEIAIRRGLPL